jgi:uncharacterized protein YbjT (DUF2867 family)
MSNLSRADFRGTNKSNRSLIIGATGKTGRRVASRLKDRGLPFLAGSRSAQPAFDWENQATWGPCLDGATQAYVSYYPDLCVPGAVQTVQSLFAAAVDAGVRKIVLLSGRGEWEAEQAEHALRACGAQWTILRCSFFSQNFSENFFLDSILAGEVALPVRPIAEPFVDAEDIADVAVAALTDDRHTGQVYELTGPRSISFASAIHEIARATGRDIRFLAVTSDAYRVALIQAQVPESVIDLILYLFGTVLDGRNEKVADGVCRVLGREPRDFSDYVNRTAATGVWGGR